MLIRALLDIPASRAHRRLRRLLAAEQVVVSTLGRRESLWQRLHREDCDLVVLAEGRVPAAAAPFISGLRELPERPEAVVVSDEEDPARRAALLAAGCLAVLWLGLPDDSLREALSALLRRRHEDATRTLQRPPARCSLHDFVSDSPPMQRFLAMTRRVVGSDSALLILGETGVGKERLARAIHAEGPRAGGPFLALNPAALPETLLESELFGHEEGAFTGAHRPRRGCFELAHRGTLFLDEVGEIPAHLQVKLLRVLEDRQIRRVGGEHSLQVDVRLMAATNRDLEAEMRAGRFRADLFFRLAVVTLNLPPLRERREDIAGLAQAYLDHFRVHLGRPVLRFDAAALAALQRYGWPGNVRELINAVERAVLLCAGEEVRVADLPRRIVEAAGARPGGGPPLHPEAVGGWPADLWGDPLPAARRRLSAAFERAYLERLLRETGGRVGQTARCAGIRERSLFTLMRRHDLRKEDYRPGAEDRRRELRSDFPPVPAGERLRRRNPRKGG